MNEIELLIASMIVQAQKSVDKAEKSDVKSSQKEDPLVTLARFFPL